MLDSENLRTNDPAVGFRQNFIEISRASLRSGDRNSIGFDWDGSTWDAEQVI